MSKIPDNHEIADILYEIGEYLEMENDTFRAIAHKNAAEVIRGLDRELSGIYEGGGIKALMELPGIGKGIAEKIEELLKTGKLKQYQELKRKMPVNISEMTAVEGIGPKMVKKLYQELKIKDLAGLEKAAREGNIRTLEHFGAKSEAKILKGIEFLKGSGGRAILGFVMPKIRDIEARLAKHKDVEKVVVAGSVRRRKETIGDIDILVVSSNPKPVMDFFVSMPEVIGVHAHGPAKSMVRLSLGFDADIRVVAPESFGAAVNYFTGSKEHNIALRELAIHQGYKLNEYGLYKGKKQVAGKTEDELYEKLGLHYIEPELREMTGEIEAARAQKLPALIGYGDLAGDLQVQTDWSDGKKSIEHMARAVAQRGLKYIAITDHTKRLTVANGLDEKRLRGQMAEIDKVQKKLGSAITILKGTECDILKDGSLDLSDDALAKLDVVGASVHAYFNLTGEEQTRRIIRAMENPHVDIVFHPTGRVINRREPYAVDMGAIITAAKRTGTVLEIDAFPDRLDIKDEHIRKCVEAGVKMSIDSDAHDDAHLEYLEWGLAQARRGWAKRTDIINAWPVEKMKKFLKK